MITPDDFPEIAIVRVVTAGGPYETGATLSVAFVTPGLARLATHDESVLPATPSGSLVPEMISARVIRGAGPYEAGASLALSFVDPAIARIHPTPVTDDRRSVASTNTTASSRVSGSRSTLNLEIKPAAPLERATPETISVIARAPVARTHDAEQSLARAGVRVRLDWNRDRVRRFVQVVEKLFTIDKLGWYRHVFAMRLLVPDAVTCGEPKADVEALRHLHALRAASIETLGRPLLAAFMPGFAVTTDWLDSLDKPGAARALAGLRESLLQHANDASIRDGERGDGWTIAAIRHAELTEACATSIESLLPTFIPCESPAEQLAQTLGNYRAALIDIFGQTTQSPDNARLALMVEPNHTLDDRLSLLVRSVNETFGSLAVA